MACYFYILQSEQDNSYYLGHTCTDLAERLAKHNRPHRGYTARKQPWKLVYSETYGTKSGAKKREQQVKSWKNRQAIVELVNG